MSLYLEHAFAKRLSYKVDKFSQKSDSLYNFRCNICNDSSKNKAKARAYIYERAGKLYFFCHNCGASMSFSNYLKATDHSMYKEYMFEIFKDKKESEPVVEKVKDIVEKDTKILIPSISSLSKDHAVYKYCKSRNIPESLFDRLYYAKNFDQFVKDINPDYDKDLGTEPRLIIPFRNERGFLVGFTGRDLSGKAKSKYITVKLGKDDIKYYTKEPLNFSKKIYVVEGPIDSMFLPNAVATLDATLMAIIRYLESNKHEYVFIHDNEPRNSQVVANMQKVITSGYKICIWPSYVNEKDINEMILTGNYSDIKQLIDDNTYQGIEAQLKFTEWRKK